MDVYTNFNVSGQHLTKSVYHAAITSQGVVTIGCNAMAGIDNVIGAFR